MNAGRAVVLRGDARALPLPDASVDLIVTSPPYFGLRSYTDGCPTCADDAKMRTRGYMERYCPGCGKTGTVQVCPKCGLTTLRTEATKAANRKTDCPDCGGSGQRHYEGQIGSEATPQEWLAALVACTAEWMRVLKPEGSMFVNLGDKYDAGTNAPRKVPGELNWIRKDSSPRGTTGHPKCLLGLPWRYALAATDQLGLILRAEIIWAKPNGLPESVTDRVRRAHEQVFHFTKQPRYYSAVDEIREEQITADRKGLRTSYPPGSASGSVDANGHHHHREGSAGLPLNPLGKLPGSVWDIAEHETLVRSILRAVSAGGLTIDEAERLITGGLAWTGPNGSRPGSNAPRTAGTGPGSSTARATGTTAAPMTDSGQPTASPTNSGPAPSLPGSPSTTSAATGDASTPPTSRPSPSARTSGEAARPPRPTASTGMSSTWPTPTSEPTGTGSAGHVCGSECEPVDDVWSIPSQPLTVPARLGVDHFAAFPMELPRRLVLAWSPPGVCVACGQGRRPVVDKRLDLDHMQRNIRVGFIDGTEPNGNRRGVNAAVKPTGSTVATVTGYVCACTPYTDHPGTGSSGEGYNRPGEGIDAGRRITFPDTPGPPSRLSTRPKVGGGREYHFDAWTPPPTRPAVVLDPFSGTGTAPLVASALGRIGIGVDRSADYCRLAKWRTTDPGERAKAMEVPKPPPQLDGQGELFEELM